MRKHLKHLKGTTLKTLLEGDGMTPPVLPRGTYEHNKSEGSIKIIDGGEIIYFGLDDPLNAGSFNFSGIGIEEWIELTETDYRMLQGCVRVAVPGISNEIYGVCNPSVPSHWVAKEFGLALDFKPQPGCRAIFTSPYDNFALPPDFVADLEGLPGIARKRFLLGLWIGSDGLVYDRWDRNVHVESVAVADSGDGQAARDIMAVRAIIAVDEGYTNPFAALHLSVDGDGRMHCAREFYHRQCDVAQKIAAVKDLGGMEAEAVIVDPSAADLIREFRNAGLPVLPARNEVFDGIMQVQARLTPAGDGKPRLTVDPGCDNLIREFETYEWKPNRATGATKDEPIKAHDHALDALRYAVAYLDAGIVPHVAVGSPKIPSSTPPPTPFDRVPDAPAVLPYGHPARPWQRASRPRY